ncbi:MAG: SUMF1/EgtB/PvdO family nonheme iron enzyme [Planctomycetota bacterium]
MPFHSDAPNSETPNAARFVPTSLTAMHDYEHLEEKLAQLFEKLRERNVDLEDFDWSVSQQGTNDSERRLGEFRILREIGRGGMGCRVYEAEQLPLRRRVALKVLPPHLSVSDEAVLQFRLEAEAGGRLQHPGIVAVYAVGTVDGAHYIAQEFVDPGETLADRLPQVKERGLPARGYFRQTASLIASVAEALHHAHQAKVIHRDIKPSNILITRHGLPKITDFGLAKLEDALTLSRSGDVRGTPSYMSPEQVDGKRRRIDSRTDIYSLGVTLYEMLTLTRPYDAESSQEVLNKIIVCDPPAPHRVDPRVPHDLSAIALKAMEKEPGHRYSSMAALADDLHRYLQGEVISARPAGLGTIIWRKVKRRKVLSAAIGTALTAVLAWVVFGPMLYIRIVSERDRAEQQTREVLRLADVKLLADLEMEAEQLWPARPRLVPALERWLEQAEGLASRRAKHLEDLQELRRRALPYTAEKERQDFESHPRRTELDAYQRALTEIAEWIGFLQKRHANATSADDEQAASAMLEKLRYRQTSWAIDHATLEGEMRRTRTWEFVEREDQWRHDALAGLIEGLDRLLEQKNGTMRKIRDRLAFAKTVEARSLDSFGSEWAAAIASIADRGQCPCYEGLVIRPQLGFAPLGQDARSGLWEFLHLETGKAPERATDGRIVMTQETGLVFVLIPGGTFSMGAERPSATRPLGSPNVDAHALADESPVHEVTLEPFLLSKFEMTHAQWLRATEQPLPPSGSRGIVGDHVMTLDHPVMKVSWNDSVKVLGQLELRLPAEAEWEYACRAGTTTIWWPGDEKESLQGKANLADHYMATHNGPPHLTYEPWLDDGYTSDAPVGNYEPNPFGFHDMHGNVFEWCHDVYERYEADPPARLQAALGMQPQKVHRGGSWHVPAVGCRSAARGGLDQRFVDAFLGVRPAATLQR